MLMTENYRLLNKQLHFICKKYGAGAFKDAPEIAMIATEIRAHSLLDYGCGKGTLKRALVTLNTKLDVYEYDPALDIDERRPCDLVVCRDMLEHVEPECLDAVLEDLRRLTIKCMHFVIATKPSNDILSDGSNAHRIIEPSSWWKERMNPYFEFSRITTGPKNHCVGEAKPR